MVGGGVSVGLGGRLNPGLAGVGFGGVVFGDDVGLESLMGN